MLPGHALLLTAIAAGRMIVKTEEADQTYALDTGFLEAVPGHIHVITDHCQAAGDVDADSVKEEIAEIEKQFDTDELAPGLTRNFSGQATEHVCCSNGNF